MQRPRLKAALSLLAAQYPMRDRSAQSTPASPKTHHQEYVDGYTYRKVASSAQAQAVIQEFCQQFLGRILSPQELAAYLQQWHQGRSLRSIRDEIANCLEAQRYGW